MSAETAALNLALAAAMAVSPQAERPADIHAATAEAFAQARQNAAVIPAGQAATLPECSFTIGTDADTVWGGVVVRLHPDAPRTAVLKTLVHNNIGGKGDVSEADRWAAARTLKNEVIVLPDCETPAEEPATPVQSPAQTNRLLGEDHTATPPTTPEANESPSPASSSFADVLRAPKFGTPNSPAPAVPTASPALRPEAASARESGTDGDGGLLALGVVLLGAATWFGGRRLRRYIDDAPNRKQAKQDRKAVEEKKKQEQAAAAQAAAASTEVPAAAAPAKAARPAAQPAPATTEAITTTAVASAAVAQRPRSTERAPEYAGEPSKRIQSIMDAIFVTDLADPTLIAYLKQDDGNTYTESASTGIRLHWEFMGLTPSQQPRRPNFADDNELREAGVRQRTRQHAPAATDDPRPKILLEVDGRSSYVPASWLDRGPAYARAKLRAERHAQATVLSPSNQ